MRFFRPFLKKLIVVMGSKFKARVWCVGRSWDSVRGGDRRWVRVRGRKTWVAVAPLFLNSWIYHHIPLHASSLLHCMYTLSSLLLTFFHECLSQLLFFFFFFFSHYNKQVVCCLNHPSFSPLTPFHPLLHHLYHRTCYLFRHARSANPSKVNHSFIISCSFESKYLFFLFVILMGFVQNVGFFFFFF